ncbi:hypothetical protein K491DRAFT_696400 [Lophiostoma macrostomum CBS 122681]|uniref:Uncharacterized protein n=1 Tax=Lophiostoma macrostomum CBS 122681 TaxID=1314788 RepID=A0A6A6SYB5_9PLEO|nr:hypothetical protein K491DRAFT_696400 [Lophiostoma macrostomum CBS 122681]
MHSDRTNSNNGRPLKPTLATTRTAKTPIAPRLAPSVASSVSSSQTSRTARSNVGTTPRAATTAHQEDVTPVKAFLSNNITPRSSSRKSRVGVSSTNSTPSPTPSATPTSTRPASTVDFSSRDHGHGYSGLGGCGLPGAQSNSRPRSTVGGSNSHTPAPARAPLTNLYNHAASDVGAARDGSPMFFHANDARSQDTAPPPPPKKGPVFFYANGQQDETLRALPAPSPPLSATGRSQVESKFFHVDALSEARSNPPILTPPPNSALPEPWAVATSTPQFQSLRPPSPSKENIHLSYRKGASQVIRPTLSSRTSALSIISGQSHIPECDSDRSKRRRSSAASSVVRLGHGKSASLSSIDSVASLKKVSTNDSHSIAPSPLHNEKRVISNGSLSESVASAPALETSNLSGLHSPSLPSPTKSSNGKSALEHMNGLAANARRERKVLDLEISNSSLLAINRQLEKEVRKQKAEIRRFRRMSRAGRFSTDTIVSDPEGFSAVGVGDFGELSDMDEEVEEDQEDPESSSDSSFDEGTMSPTTLAERDAAHRIRDERRLQLDLSKHRELLLDSQKMNQSLKRCLTWTEDLIKDAQKALNYQVRVSDVRLGGRVLISEEQPETEQEEDSKAGGTLLSPWTPPHQAINSMGHLSLNGSDRPDRDSGVDLDGLQSVSADPQCDDIPPLGSPLYETPAPSALATSNIRDAF